MAEDPEKQPPVEAAGSPPVSSTDLSTEALQEIESRREEAEAVLAAGPGSGNRAGAFAFLAVLALAAGAVYYHWAARGGDAFPTRLDSQLRNHAELSMAAMNAEAPMAVVPSWPVGLYHSLRGDIVVYSALAALAAYLWSRSAAARARRDAFILQDRLSGEIDELRKRLDEISAGTRLLDFREQGGREQGGDSQRVFDSDRIRRDGGTETRLTHHSPYPKGK